MPIACTRQNEKRCKRNIPLFARQKQQRHRSSMERQQCSYCSFELPWHCSFGPSTEMVVCRQVENYNSTATPHIQIQLSYGRNWSHGSVAQYRINLRSKKWWWPFFAYCADVAMQNAWLVYRQSESQKWMPVDQLEFRRAVCRTYFSRYVTVTKLDAAQSLGQPKRLKHRVLEEVHFDGLNHVIAACGKQRRCGWCSKKVTHVCTKCDTGLHIRCFADFHKKQ